MERKSGYESSYWVYTILVDNRDSFMKMMSSNGIGCSRVHDRNDKHSCFGGLADLSGTSYVNDKMVSIPCGWWVGREDLEYIVRCIKNGW